MWALERSGGFRGRYHVLGGTLSPIDGIGPEELGIARLIARAAEPEVTRGDPRARLYRRRPDYRTLHRRALAECAVAISGIAHGVPLGGELHYLDDATLATALSGRRNLG